MAVPRDTICALASGAPPSAIGIIRVSGPAAPDIAKAILSDGVPPAREATLSRIIDSGGQTLDQGLALFFPAPASYTGEDVLELMLHGGRAIIEAVVEAILEHPKTRLADPGEFTQRAFEAGKMDLTEAEAVADLIDADTDGQRQQALAQLGGRLSDTYEKWRRDLIEILALVEVAVDFPDEGDAPDHTDAPVLEKLDRLKRELSSALDDGQIGERIRDGFRIALIGAPNAGKSSLLNRIAQRDAAIVTDVPGTTRDVLEVRLALAGQVAWLLDTAGLRESDDVVEAEGIRRARLAAETADLRVLVVDGTRPNQDLPPLPDGDLIAWNKCDDPAACPPPVNASRETFEISARTGEGMDALVSAMADRIRTQANTAPSALITRARHRDGLSRAVDHISRAEEAMESGTGAEFAAEDIRLGVHELAALMGTIDVEDILSAVFSEFCIGK